VPDDSVKLPAAFLHEGDESYAQDINLLLTRELPVTVEARLRSDTGNLPTLANRMLADLERAITSGPTQDGLAVSTELTGSSIVYDEAPGVLASVRCEFLVSYRTVRGNPANKG
jgi:hypothetical protein